MNPKNIQHYTNTFKNTILNNDVQNCFDPEILFWGKIYQTQEALLGRRISRGHLFPQLYLKELRHDILSRFQIEKFSLNFSIWLFVIRVNLRHP